MNNYEILELDEESLNTIASDIGYKAAIDVIKGQKKRLSKDLHPDTSSASNAVAVMQAINAAADELIAFYSNVVSETAVTVSDKITVQGKTRKEAVVCGQPLRLSQKLTLILK